MKKAIVGAAVAAGLLLGSAGAAVAEKPGPGDKQCIPGQQGNPHPAHKAGVCPNP
jgi:hypothetical protein